MRGKRDWRKIAVLSLAGLLIFLIGTQFVIKRRHAHEKHEANSEEHLEMGKNEKEVHMKLAFPMDGDRHPSDESGENSKGGGFITDHDENAKGDAGGQCKNFEFRSFGFQHSDVKNADWQKVVNAFNKSKKTLSEWLKATDTKFPEKTVAFMTSQLDRLKLIRPPSIEEPDLSWRGIGVWSRDEHGNGIIRLNTGFVKLVLKQPRRGMFEMTRLVAQSIAPCELERAGVWNPWQPLLKCLEVEDHQGCAAGTYSEAGWGVSSSLAVALATPECALPIFENKDKLSCLEKHLGVKPGAEKASEKGHEKK